MRAPTGRCYFDFGMWVVLSGEMHARGPLRKVAVEGPDAVSKDRSLEVFAASEPLTAIFSNDSWDLPF